MSNSIYNVLGGKQAANSDGFGKVIEEFQRFKNTYRGDAKTEVQRLLDSGRMTQAQFNQFGQMANQIMKAIK